MSEQRPPYGQEDGPVEDGGPTERHTRFERGEYREFGLTNFALHHRVSALVLLVLIVILGAVAYSSVPKESSPEITIPMIAVSVIYPGVAPGDMETLVARPLEDELNTIPELDELTSTSVEGYTNVLAEFENGMDMEEALQKVREKVDLARPELPVDAEEPVISEFNFAEFPILQVNVSGEYGLERLKEVAEDLQEELERIPAILEVRLSGGLEREVRVAVDLPKLKYYNVSYDDIVEAIAGEHINVPGGAIDVGNVEYNVRVAGEFTDTRPIEDIVVAMAQGRPIYVRDLATVDFAYEDRETYARLDGAPVVTLDVVKRSGENIIETAEAVKATIAAMQAEFPPTTVVKVTADQSEDIHKMVSTLENNIISGLLLVLVVLMFFLGVRNAWFVAISIPLSMLLAFMVMELLGISMNMVVLFSLILALGMLVDNATVVVENIYRFIEEGADNWTAARRATGEIAMPIIASTATTLAAFAPLLFWPGIAGEFMSYLPLTLIITLASSLFVALIIVPVLCALFMRLDTAEKRPATPEARWTAIGIAAVVLLIVAANNPLTAALMVATLLLVVVAHKTVMERVGHWFQEKGLPRVVEHYGRVLRWSLDHRLVIVVIAGVSLVGSVFIFGKLNAGTEYFPESVPPALVRIEVDAPSGTRPAFLNRLAERAEAQLDAVPGMEDAESVVATVGSTGGNPIFAGGGDANVTINFRDFEERERDTFETLSTLQSRIGQGIAGGEVTVVKQEMGPPGGAPVSIEITGEDPAVLKRLADRAIAILESASVGERLEGLESDMSDARPEMVVEVDREKAALYDLSTAEVGRTIRAAIQGVEAAKFRPGTDEEYDIVVRLREEHRRDLDALRDLTIVSEDRQVPLLSVANWRVEEGFGSVNRKDLDRMVTITSDVRTGENSNAVLADVQRTLERFQAELPPGYRMAYTGEQEDQQEAMAFLSGAFLIALMLMAFILISQFNSVIKPVIILTSVIMSTVGVLLGLVVFRMPFGIIMTGVGIISLAGVVVNNAIVLIDYIDILRERDGLVRRAALVQGGMTRFRPVVLTAVTTILGLVPLAIGLNFDFFGLYRALDPNLFWGGEQAAWWGPMAVAVIAGLAFATLLTLILVPVMYSLVDDLGDFFRRHYTWEGREQPRGDGSVAGPHAPAAPGGDGAGAPDRDGRESPADAPEPERAPQPATARERRPLGELRPGGA